MTTLFDEIGETNEVPSSLTEVGSTGPTGSQPKRVAILGHRLVSGTVPADVPFLVTGESTGDAGAGLGSQLGAMCRSYKALDRDSVVHAVGLADDGAGVAATGSIQVTGTATAVGSLVARVGGRRYEVT
ncbi:MAG: hypothetical protein H5U40_06955, partial [Polyangiaceae bacterium]|nr:hypothetical protein [Polyangiaceae bacterium]